MGSIGLQSSGSGSGGAGANNANFSDLGTADSIGCFIGPSVQLPIFNYGRLKNNVRVQDARFQQLVLTYQNTVLQAFQDVENATVGFLKTQEQNVFLSESVEQYRLSVSLSLTQYGQGLVSFQRVIDAQRNLAQQEDVFATVTGSVGANLIAIYKALGAAGNCVMEKIGYIRNSQPVKYVAGITMKYCTTGLFLCKTGRYR